MALTNSKRQLVTTTQIRNVRKVFTDVDRGAALERYKQISGISLEEGLDIVFAEPVQSRDLKHIDWFTSLEGELKPFKKLDETAAKEVKFKVWSAITTIDKLVGQWRKENKKSLVSAMEESLEVPSMDSVYLLRDKVVLCNWGFISDEFKAERGILRRISDEFSDAKLVVTIVNKDAQGIPNASVNVNQRQTLITDNQGQVSVKGLQVGSSVEIKVFAESFESSEKVIHVRSPNTFEEIKLESVTGIGLSTLQLRLVDHNRKILSGKLVKASASNEKPIKAKSNEVGLADISELVGKGVVKVSAGILYSANPKFIDPTPENIMHDVELKSRFLWLLLPLFLLFLTSGWFYYVTSQVFAPVLSVDIQGRGKVTGMGEACSSDQSPCNIFYAGLGRTEIAAEAADGYKFLGWKGACTTTDLMCDLTLTKNESVSAVFDKEAYKVSVSLNSAHGLIHSSVPIANGIKCGLQSSDCDEQYSYGASVDLDAQETTNYQFDEWVGGCVDPKSRRCRLIVDEDKRVIAKFKAADSILTVDTIGSGLVDVETNRLQPPNCDSDNAPCFYSKLRAGSKARLIAKEKSGYSFTRWDGACADSGSNKECRFDLTSQKKSVTAIFEKNDVVLSVELDNGFGHVVSRNNDINCTSTGGCSKGYLYGSTVSLEAKPYTDGSGQQYIFTGWGGECGGKSTCEVTLVSSTNIVAKYQKLMVCSPKLITNRDPGLDSGFKGDDYTQVWNLGKSKGNVDIYFDPEDRPDNIKVTYEGRELINGCYGDGDKLKKTLSIDGTETTMLIEVIGSCQKGYPPGATYWALMLECPK